MEDIDNSSASLRKDLLGSQTFIDYFICAGIDHSIKKNLQNPHSAKPQILSVFPPFDKKFVSLDESILPVFY